MIKNRLRRRLAALCLLSALALAGAQGAWAVDPSLLLVPPSGSVSEEDADASGVSGEETAPEGLEGRFVTTGGNTSGDTGGGTGDNSGGNSGTGEGTGGGSDDGSTGGGTEPTPTPDPTPTPETTPTPDPTTPATS